MPGFTLTGRADAPVEEVWKLLFDPTRFPEWWVGIESARNDRPGEATLWLVGSPDLPLPQHLRSDRRAGQVTISCQVSDIDVAWRLAEADAGTAIEVRVDFRDAKTDQLDARREIMGESLAKLAALAESMP